MMNLTQFPRWLRDHYLATGLLVLISGFSQALVAATLIVNSLEDTTLADGQCTLREALENANQDTAGVGDCLAGSGDDVIDLTGLNGTITLTAQLKITSNLILEGPGAEKLTLSGDRKYQVFWVGGDTTVEIKGVKISNGYEKYYGSGGISSSGTLTITNSTISGNSSSYDSGGISSSGTLTITNSTISGNSSRSYDGGGISSSGTLTITNSTISGNFAGSSGGGISSFESKATLINTTVSGNSAKYHGGGILNEAGSTLTLINSTISENVVVDEPEKSWYGGGGIYNGDTLNLQNTLIANNTNGDCYNSEWSTIGTNLNNFIGDGSCNPTFSGDPQLGPLANNGGPTFTHALLRGSPAIDAGDDTICAAEPVNGLDQRGVARFGSSAGNHCDIGAYEYQKPALATLGSFTIESAAISWETLAELGTQGFYLWQAEPVVAGTCEAVTNPQLVIPNPIPAKGSEVQGEIYHTAIPVNLNWCYGIQEIPSGQIYLTPQPGRNEWTEEQWLLR